MPRAAPHVAGLSALRSRVLTVIDCMRALELGTTDCSDGIREAAVVELDGHHYALIVDQVEDVVEALSEPAPVRAAMGPGWERDRRWAWSRPKPARSCWSMSRPWSRAPKRRRLKLFVTLAV